MVCIRLTQCYHLVRDNKLEKEITQLYRQTFYNCF